MNRTSRFAQVQYVFLDVVDFSLDRTIEDQSAIVEALNEAVLHVVDSDVAIPVDSRILLPTGDGICIAILDLSRIPDPDIQIALAILRRIANWNVSATGSPRQNFEVRIGLNRNTDLVIDDVNGNPSVVGSGVNYARRVMDLADGGHILVSQSTCDVLRQYAMYHDCFLAYCGMVKHDEILVVYQFVAQGHSGLNTNPPRNLKPI